MSDSREECLQSRIWKEKKVTFVSLGFVVGILLIWSVFIYTDMPFPKDTKNVEDLLNMGLQRQLFWGVVALSSFVGFLQFLAVVDNNMNDFWLRAIFVCFVSMLTFSVTRISNLIKWVAELENQGNIPIEAPNYHNLVLSLLPISVWVSCLFLWFLFLWLFIERVTRSTKKDSIML